MVVTDDMYEHVRWDRSKPFKTFGDLCPRFIRPRSFEWCVKAYSADGMADWLRGVPARRSMPAPKRQSQSTHLTRPRFPRAATVFG